MSADGHIVVEFESALALFSTRRGGVSKSPYDSLNLGFLTGDEQTNVRANRELLAEGNGVRFAYGLQVHGNGARAANEPTPAAAPLIEADAIVTSSVGVAPMVITADCLPIAIAGDGAVAMVHAGWQGLATEVIAVAVAELRTQIDSGSSLNAVIGPGAGPCCYEVGDELHARFAALGQDHRRRRNLDLKAIAAEQLGLAGVQTVEDLGMCTICDPRRRFFSHRRDNGLTGRQGGFVWLT